MILNSISQWFPFILPRHQRVWPRAVGNLTKINLLNNQNLLDYKSLYMRLPHNSRPVVLKVGSIDPVGFDGAVSGIRRRLSDFSNSFLLSVVLGKNGVRQKLVTLH